MAEETLSPEMQAYVNKVRVLINEGKMSPDEGASFLAQREQELSLTPEQQQIRQTVQQRAEKNVSENAPPDVAKGLGGFFEYGNRLRDMKRANRENFQQAFAPENMGFGGPLSQLQAAAQLAQKRAESVSDIARREYAPTREERQRFIQSGAAKRGLPVDVEATDALAVTAKQAYALGPEDFNLYFSKRFPDAKRLTTLDPSGQLTPSVLYRKSEQEPYRVAGENPGLLGKMVKLGPLVTNIAGGVGGGLLAGLLTQNPVAIESGGALGTMASEKVNQMINRYALGGNETLPPEASSKEKANILASGLASLVFGLGTRGLIGGYNTITGRVNPRSVPGRKQAYQDLQDYQEYAKLQKAKGVATEGAPVDQFVNRPTRFTYRQSSNTTGSAERAIERATEQASDTLGGLRSSLDDYRNPAMTPPIHKLAREGADLEDVAIKRSFQGADDLSPYQTGKALQSTVDDAYRTAKNTVIDPAYANVDEAAKRSNLEFDLSGATNEARRIKIESGSTATTLEGEGAKGIPKITPKFNALLDKLDTLGDIQANWQTAKRLRSELDKIIPSLSGDEYANAMKLREKITDAYMNPIRAAGQTIEDVGGKSYDEWVKIANDEQRKAFAFREGETIAAIRGTDKPADLITRTAGNEPGLPVEKVPFAQRFAPEQLARADRGFIYKNVLTDENPAKALEEFKRLSPEKYRTMVRDPASFEKLVAARQTVLDNKQYLLTQSEHSRDLTRALDSTDPGKANIGKIHEWTANAVKNNPAYSNLSADEMMRLSAIDYVLSKGTKSLSDRYGNITSTTIDKASFQQAVERLKAKDINGKRMWDFLSQNDRIMLQGISAQTRLFKKLSDVGVSLETNRLYAELRNPSTFAKALGGLTTNWALSKMFNSKAFRRAVLGTGKAPISGTLPATVGRALGAQKYQENKFTTTDAEEAELYKAIAR